MESSFQTGNQLTESNYLMNVLFTHLAPVATGLFFVFSVSFTYVCKRKRKQVHEFTRLFALLSALTMVLLAYSYSISNTTALLRTRIDSALEYKDQTTQSILTAQALLTELATDPFVDSCSSGNLNFCKEERFFVNTSLYINNLQPAISNILSTFQNVLDENAQASLQNSLDTFSYYSSMAQWIIYGLFIGLGALIWISILGKIGGKYILHGIGGLLSFVCLVLGLGMLLGSHALADLCKDPAETLSGLVTDPDVSFYFNCTPNAESLGPFVPKGPFPPSFTEPVQGLLYGIPFVELGYLGVCYIDERYLGPLNESMLSLRNISRGKCNCDCNFTLINDARMSISSSFDNSGLFNTFECSNFKGYVSGLTGALCGFFTPFVNYFFLLLSLAGHAMFLFYFVPYETNEVFKYKS